MVPDRLKMIRVVAEELRLKGVTSLRIYKPPPPEPNSIEVVYDATIRDMMLRGTKSPYGGVHSMNPADLALKDLSG